MKYIFWPIFILLGGFFKIINGPWVGLFLIIYCVFVAFDEISHRNENRIDKLDKLNEEVEDKHNDWEERIEELESRRDDIEEYTDFDKGKLLDKYSPDDTTDFI